MKLLQVQYLIPMIVMAGVAQYGVIAVKGVASGDVPLWNLTQDTMSEAGPLRYVKDAFVLFFSIVWPIAITKFRLGSKMQRFVYQYFIWFALVTALGLCGFLFYVAPIRLFLPAGLRWLLLMHVSFGIFLVARPLSKNLDKHNIIFVFLTLVALVDFLVVLMQLRLAASIYNLAIGASRLTGLFNNAGVAGFFAMQLALLALILDGVQRYKRNSLILLAVFLALASGTRFACLFVLLTLTLSIWKSLAGLRIKTAGLKLFFIPVAAVGFYVAYTKINQQVDRGDAISQQFSEGGRAHTVLTVFKSLTRASVDELLFGRGLGVGTNTAVGALKARGIDPKRYRFNLQADNTFITTFYQFGLLGSVVFWTGIFSFLVFAKPRYSDEAKTGYRMLVVVFFALLFLGNPFEHYFLMTSCALGFSYFYWSDMNSFQQRESAKPFRNSKSLSSSELKTLPTGYCH